MEYPTATAEPGRSVCGANVPSGPGGTASTGRPAFAAAFVSAVASGVLSPLTEIGALIGLALAIAHFIRADTFGPAAPPRGAAPDASAPPPRAALARAAPRPRAALDVFALAFAADLPAVAGRAGTSTGVPRIASIEVASAILPPYSLTDCEIAPMFRFTPAPSGQ